MALSEEELSRRWHERFLQLKEFYDEHGHSNVPRDYAGGLGEWIHSQRRAYREGKMKACRLQKLNTVEFRPSTRANQSTNDDTTTNRTASAETMTGRGSDLTSSTSTSSTEGQQQIAPTTSPTEKLVEAHRQIEDVLRKSLLQHIRNIEQANNNPSGSSSGTNVTPMSSSSSSSVIVQSLIDYRAQVNSSLETLISNSRMILGVVGDSNTNIAGPPQQMDPEHETQRSAGTTQTAAAAAAGAGGSSSFWNTNNGTTNQPSSGTPQTIAAAAASSSSDAGGGSGNGNTNNGVTNQPSTGNPAAGAAAGASVGINVNIENGTTNQPSTPCFGDSSNNVNIETLRTTNQPPSVSPETSDINMTQSNGDSTIGDDGRYNQSNNQRKRSNAPPSDSSNITGEFICRYFNGSDESHPPPAVDSSSSSSSSNKRTKIKQEREV